MPSLVGGFVKQLTWFSGADAHGGNLCTSHLLHRRDDTWAHQQFITLERQQD